MEREIYLSEVQRLKSMKRNLDTSEIEALCRYGCSCDDWTKIYVCEHFDPIWCRYVHFSGECIIGDLSGSRTNEYGVPLKNGIYHAAVNDCVIEDGVCISHIRECISRYHIGKNSVIINTNVIAMKGESYFGNDVQASVMNETGGFEVPLSRHLTAQTAYLLTMLRPDHQLKEHLLKLFAKDAEECKSAYGYIGENVVIKNSGTIINAWIGEYTVIDSATRIQNCSLCSTAKLPVYIGDNVIAEDFIASTGAHISDGSVVARCFVGQSSKVEHLFSAHDSLLFSNCTLENGEACAVFAGPFTVSSHKSSLLIAGYFAFLNAGSGSNQSNHLYKLGPMHRGVVERGSKTASDSYVLWPSRIGAFSIILGRHVHHVDTTSFPFSYVIENKNETYLVPGRNLFSIGTMRDARKWPSRDKRPVDMRLDCINYNLLSPFTIGKMEEGYHKLKELQDFVGVSDHTYVFNNLNIRPSALKKGCQYYQYGIEKFIGNSLIQRIQDKFGSRKVRTIEELHKALLPDHDDGLGEWIDVCGMITPTQELKSLIMEPLCQGHFNSLNDLNHEIRQLHKRYYDLEWDWSFALMLRWYGLKDVNEINPGTISVILQRWILAVIRIDENLYADARNEFDIVSRVNFGIDVSAPEQVTQEYSDMVNAEFKDNAIVRSVEEHMDKKNALYTQTLQQLSPILH